MQALTVDVDEVTFSYAKAKVLDRADLKLRQGEFAILTGPNGSGKSTLLKLCLGLLRPDSGRVGVLGGDPSDPAVRRRVGYAPQGLHMTAALPVSVSEVVAAGLTPAKGLLHRMNRKDWTRVTNVVDAVGLRDLAAECLFELSGGQQQRAILARALVSNPALLLLDEPTTGIDRRLRPMIARELRVRADEGATVIAVSHDPDDFHTVSDRILILEDGRLRQITHEEFHTHLEAAET